jgi:A/G-specific adenine glycosylase
MNSDRFQSRLLDWYRASARDLPWRRAPGTGPGPGNAPAPDPYRVWLSEVMLQQTTVAHATPYYAAFLSRWPTVCDLADAEDAEVMAAWAGLGYYARARNLLACARAVRDRFDGRFPDTEAGLLSLPGVGPYTAAAVAAIAFDRPANVVDGNVERVMSRLFAVEAPLPAARPKLRSLAAGLVEAGAPGDWAQALMDLGATVCRPRSPRCDLCPATEDCAARASGTPEAWPRKSARAARPTRSGLVFVLRNGDGVAVVRRPPRGLLGGMLGLPTTDWTPSGPDSEAIAAAAPARLDWREAGAVDHVFTHFSLELRVLAGEGPANDVEWLSVDALGDLPSVFLKAARRALAMRDGG